MADDCCAPQWVDLTSSPQQPSDDYFDKIHEIHLPSKLLENCKKAQECKIIENLQKDARILQDTPIKVIYQPPGKKCEIIKTTTCHDIIQEEMNNLLLSSKPSSYKKQEAIRPKLLVCQYRRQSIKTKREHLQKSFCVTKSTANGSSKDQFSGVNFNKSIKASRSIGSVQIKQYEQEEMKENCTPLNCQLKKQSSKGKTPRRTVSTVVGNNGQEIVIKKEEALFYGIPIVKNKKKSTVPVPFSFDSDKRPAKLTNVLQSTSNVQITISGKQEVNNTSKEKKLKAVTAVKNNDSGKRRHDFQERARQWRAIHDEKRRKEQEEQLAREKAEKAKLRKEAEIKARSMPVYKSMVTLKSSKLTTQPETPVWAKKR